MTPTLWKEFVGVVASRFGFLESDFGFARTSTQSPNVIFESDRLQVQLYFDAFGRQELDLRLAPLDEAHRDSLSLSIGTLMRLSGSQATYRSPVSIADANTLDLEASLLADLLRKYGAALLNGDLSQFDEADRLEQELAAKLARPQPHNCS